MAQPKHILVGTDFSETSCAAVETARDLARALGAKLTLLHALAPQLDALGPALSMAERMRIGRELHADLVKLKDRAQGVSDLRTEVVEGDHPASVICRYASDHAVDLIVVGSHGRTGLKSLLIVSIAERVTRHAPCSVLVAR